MRSQQLTLSVSDFVGLLNQTLEVAYPHVCIVGELANFRVSKNRWVYFDLKDELASLRFFGSVYQLPGPLEDGLVLQVRGNPRLHPQYGFSVSVVSIQPVGEGSLRRAAALLEAKLRAEGLFESSRKRPLPYPSRRVGLITSAESAAYADFMKILRARWGGVEVLLADVQVQGEPAPAQLEAAIEHCNGLAEPPDVLVLTRGGGSPEDLAAFSNELVVRAVAASRIPTLVAIGHEVDQSLAELAADRRASTPSNAAELLVPDKQHELVRLAAWQQQLGRALDGQVVRAGERVQQLTQNLTRAIQLRLDQAEARLDLQRQLLEALNPQRILQQGYAIVRTVDGRVIRRRRQLRPGQAIRLQLADGQTGATIDKGVQ